MTLVQRSVYWSQATCVVCGDRSPEWVTPQLLDDDGERHDHQADAKIAAGHGYREHVLFDGTHLLVCAVCRAVLAHRQIQQAEKEGRL